MGCSRVSDSHFSVSGRQETHQSVRPGGISKTLCVAITCAIRCASDVHITLGPVLEHLAQIQRPVHAAPQLRHIHIKADLLVHQPHHLVVLLVLREEVHSRRDSVIRSPVKQVLPHRDGVPTGQDAHAPVVYALERAVLGARRLIRADRLRVGPRRAGGLPVVDSVELACEGVCHEGCVLLHAAAIEGAAVGRKAWVDFWDGGADLLGGGADEEGQRSCRVL